MIDYLIGELQGKVPATLIANTVVNTMKSLQRDGVDVSVITEDHLKAIFNEYSQGVITKEAIPDVIAAWSKEPNKPINDIINKLGGLRRMSPEEVRRYVMEKAPKLGINDRNKLMNALMKELRGGRADPNDIMAAINEYLRNSR